MTHRVPAVLLSLPLLALSGVAATAHASDDACRNSCVTMSIPGSPDGVHTRFDGTSDAALWPADGTMKTIRIAALNDQARKCDVTIRVVAQSDNADRAAGKADLEDAGACDNLGHESTVQLRSIRSDAATRRAYRVDYDMADPDCTTEKSSDQVLVVVPLSEHEDGLEVGNYDDEFRFSHADAALSCDNESDLDGIVSARLRP